MAFERDRSAGYLANHMARLFAQALRDAIGPLGIDPGQFPALLALWEEDGLTQRQLVERTNVEQATMANTLVRMERSELVLRAAHPSDARARLIRLTPKARSLMDLATAKASAVNDTALAGLSDVERKTFLELMQRVIKSLRERQDEQALESFR